VPSDQHPLPTLRYMGSKHRLLPWIEETLASLEFTTALDAFAGSATVAHLLKRMGKAVTANDTLHFSSLLAEAVIANSKERLDPARAAALFAPNRHARRFIRTHFAGVFYDPATLTALDTFWANLDALDAALRPLALAALFRACAKKQPRGVFTVAGDPLRYDDGRRDLRAPIEALFAESLAAYNAAVFDNGRPCHASRADVFDLPTHFDLVYLDPPYVPRADDNCYIKRYHFLEGLASYWQAPGTEILAATRTRKLAKRFTPFSYRHTAVDAFRRLFRRFASSTLVLSYSSTAFPDLDTLVALLGEVKPRVEVHQRPHRYHFGTHAQVSPARARVQEYLLVAREN